jgi:GNAT superfamily N-acetyltransferase
LCQRDTEEHPEFGLLEAMGRRFRQETGALPLAVGTPGVAGRACLQEIEVHFILQPDGLSDTVVGYAAFSHEEQAQGRPLDAAMGPGGLALPELVQLYVEPEFRRRGVATAALGVLLARRNAVLVSTRSAPGNGGDQIRGVNLFGTGGTLRVAGSADIIGMLGRLGFQQDLLGAEAAAIATGCVLCRRPGPLYGVDENLR